MKYFLALSAGILLLYFSMAAQAAMITVDTIDDLIAADGQCSLREAVMNANGANQSGSTDCVAGDAGGNTIVFPPALSGQTLVLNGTPLPNITRSLTIEGPVANDWSGLTIDGDDQVRIFAIDAGFSGSFAATLRGLTLTKGRTDALNQPGGALWVRNVELELEHVNIHDNRTTGPSSLAGAFWITGGEVRLIDSRVADNTAQNAAGGIAVTNGELELLRSTVAGNQASSVGGGIRAENSTVRLYQSTISGNSATGTAGGLSLNTSTMLAVNSTISGNSASTSAGAFYARLSEVTLIHSTVAFNTGLTTHGIFLFALEGQPASLDLINSLVVQAETSHVTCTAPSEFATITSTNSLATHAGCTGTATPVGAINLATLADNGGPTLTHALQAGSVAINGGSDCPDDHDIDSDQRGQPRPGGLSGACDIGAYETQEIPPAADMTLSMSVLPQQAGVGDTVIFTLTASNLGPDAATGVVVTDQLPDGFAYVGSTADQGAYDAHTGLWTIGTLAADGDAELTIEATVTSSGPYLNVASIGADPFDPDPSNNQAQAEVVIVEPQADLALSKLVQPAQAEVGAAATFTLLAANLGPNAATGVVVTDQLPAGYQFVDAAASQGSFDALAGQWSVGALAADGGATLTIDVIVTAVDDYLNNATITGDQVDPDAVNNNSSAGIVLSPPETDPIIVTTDVDVVANDGLCSLREAIINANGANQSGSEDCGGGGSSGNRIVFHPDLSGATIVVESFNLPNITRPLTIEGPVTGDPAGLVLDGNALNRVLGATSGAHLSLRDLTLTGGGPPGGSGGGGVLVNSADLRLERVLISGNAANVGGGGVRMANGELQMIDSTVTGNTTTGTGAGIQMTSTVATITGSTITGNTSGNRGGGLEIHNGSHLDLINSTVSGNHAAGQGGGLYLSEATASVIHATVAFNTSDLFAQGIALVGNEVNPASLDLINSLIVQTQPDAAPCLMINTHTTISRHNSLTTNTGCAGPATPLAAIAIGALADNGGPTLTHALAPHSVAINGGGNCLFDHGLLIDQRGQPRPGGPSVHCDIGAYESQFVDAIFRDRFEE